MKTQILQLERHDDAVSVRDRMTWAKTPRIILVWPGRGRILNRRLDLVLLQRHAQRLGSGLGLVTKDQSVLLNARELGIPCFMSVQDAQAHPWRRARRRGLRLRKREGARPDYRADRPALPEFWNKELGTPIARIVLFAAGILAVLALAAALLPNATVQVVPLAETQTVRFDVIASPDFQTASLTGQVPVDVRSVVVEARESQPASGRTRIPDQPAQGVVRFSNLTNQSVTVPKGTVVLASGSPGARFVTVRDVRLRAEPGAAAEVPVQASAAGPAGNLPGGAIDAVEGAPGLSVSVTNPRPTSGGSEQTSPAPTQADLRELRERLTLKLQLTALEDLNLTLQPGDRLFPMTLAQTEVLDETIEPVVGQPSDQISLTLRLEYSAWVASGEDLRRIASGVLDANLSAHYSAFAETLSLRDAVPPALSSQDQIRWTVISERKVVPPVNREALVRLMTGKPRAEAGQILSQQLDVAQPPVVRTWPEWFPWMPFFPYQIQVELEGLS